MATSGTASKSSASAPGSSNTGPGAETGARTLGIDVGGSHIKAAVLDRAGGPLDKPARVDTPVGRPPEKIVDAIADLVSPLAPFDRISVGFPGVVRDGVVLSAPNLGNEGWQRFDLAGALTARLGKPTRVLNDADMQGLGAIRRRGLEMVITLGTGFGTGLYLDGRLLPHLEIAHLRFRNCFAFGARAGAGDLLAGLAVGPIGIARAGLGERVARCGVRVGSRGSGRLVLGSDAHCSEQKQGRQHGSGSS